MIGIIDYSLGNTANLKNALEKLGYDAIVTNDSSVLYRSDQIILPGVGHFRQAMDNINSLGLKELILDLSGQKPLLGICLGMQLLFEYSEEGDTGGLDLLKGHIEHIQSSLPVPHLGWNTLKSSSDSLDGEDVYFVHSYKVTGSNDIIASAMYDGQIPAVVRHNNITGIQFHPEKSGDAGLRILNNALKGRF